MQKHNINSLFRLFKQKTITNILKKTKIKNSVYKKNYNYSIKIIINISLKSQTRSNNGFINITKLNNKKNKQIIYSLRRLISPNPLKSVNNNQLLKYYYNTIIKDLKIFKTIEVAVHLVNTKFNNKLIVEKLSRKLFLSTVKYCNQLSFNGCRKKKIK